MAMVGLNLFVGAKAFAFGDDFEEEEPARQVTSIQNGGTGGPRRAYAGGRDEQSLEVQANLPIPSRSMDGPVVSTAPAGDDGDSTHD